MNDLRQMRIDLDFREKEAVELRLDIQRRIREGETTGRVAMDYALASGGSRDDKTLASIETFQETLREFAGQTALVVLGSWLRLEGKEVAYEIRLAKLPAEPTFRFDETGGGWTLGESFASMTTADRSGSVQAQRLAYGSTNGVASPRAERLVTVGLHVGNGEVGRFFRESKTFTGVDHQALAELIDVTVPTAKLPRTTTQRGAG
jgi:hypothetical protein